MHTEYKKGEEVISSGTSYIYKVLNDSPADEEYMAVVSINGLHMVMAKRDVTLHSHAPTPQPQFKVGDKVTHKKYGTEIFVISKIGPKFSWIEIQHKDKTFETVSFVNLTLVNEKDDTIKVEVDRCKWDNHEEAADPMKLAEKQFESWYFCKNCGLALRPFTKKKDQFKIDLGI